MSDSILSGRTFTLGRLRLRFHPLVAACVLLAVAGLLRLGLWQLDRAREKIELQEDFLNMQQVAAQPVDQLPLAGRAYDLLQHQNRQVSLRGEYLNERSIFLVYQTFEEQLGYEVVTPFRVEGGELLVLVSRGWTSAPSYEELARLLPPVKGPQELLGQIYVPSEAEAARLNPPHEARWPLLLRYLDFTELEPLFDTPLFPYVVRLNEQQPGVLVRHWPVVRVDLDRHFSYALQWFAMAIAVAIASLILASNLPELLKERRKPL